MVVNYCLFDVLRRENELLMRQLRKYVSAVQMLRRQGVADDSESTVLLPKNGANAC